MSVMSMSGVPRSPFGDKPGASQLCDLSGPIAPSSVQLLFSLISGVRHSLI
jgi:hypothetical protein